MPRTAAAWAPVDRRSLSWPAASNTPTPPAIEKLIAQIAQTGLLLSEAPPRAGFTRNRLVGRGRLLAALSAVTVVVEAGTHSSALYTATLAALLERRVGAVPGPVTSPASARPHRLLRSGAACITGADDLTELFTPDDLTRNQGVNRQVE